MCVLSKILLRRPGIVLSCGGCGCFNENGIIRTISKTRVYYILEPVGDVVWER